MTIYRVTIKFTKLAIPNIVDFDNESLAEQYQTYIDQNPNVAWVTLEEIKK